MRRLLKVLLIFIGILLGLITLLGIALLLFGKWYNATYALPYPDLEVINDMGEPLAIGEQWVEEDLFTFAVTGVTEISWSGEYPDFGVDTQNAEENNYRIFDFSLEFANINYPGSSRHIVGWMENREEYCEGLHFSVDVSAYDDADNVFKGITDIYFGGKTSIPAEAVTNGQQEAMAYQKYGRYFPNEALDGLLLNHMVCANNHFLCMVPP